MYYEKKNNRVLLRDGKSLIDSFEYSRRIFEGKDVDGFFCLRDVDSEKYDMIENMSISCGMEEVEFIPPDHSAEQNIDLLLESIENSERYTGTEEEDQRISEEIEFFLKENQIAFVLKCKELIDKFIENGVVWGVGRGSACASYVLYLLRINDVDPLKYDIPFSELSKEIKSDYDD